MTSEPLTGLSTAPEPPIQLTDAERAVWDRMPLAKRRLAVYGALEAGSAAALSTAIIIAAEAKALGLPFAVGEKLATAVKFTTGSSPRRKVLKQLRRAAAFAYEPTDGSPVLTGCCRDPRPHFSNGREGPGRLRSLMEPFCDEECARTCPMLGAIKNQAQAVAETEYANVIESSLFQPGTGLGESGRVAYELLALLATLDPDRNVVASAGYLTAKTRGQFSREAFQKALKRLNELGMVVIVGKDKALHSHIRHVPVHTDDMVEVLEAKLGVKGKRNSNMRAARQNTERYQDWLYSILTDEEKIEAWTQT